jgi:hypothetical protein
MTRKHSFVLDWSEPLAMLVSWLVLGLGAVVALIALAQTALSRRNNRWPGFHRTGHLAETPPDNIAEQGRQKKVEERPEDNDIPR